MLICKTLQSLPWGLSRRLAACWVGAGLLASVGLLGATWHVLPFTDQGMDGRIRTRHPRILLSSLTDWDGEGRPPVMAKRNALYKRLGMNAPAACVNANEGAPGLTACWIGSGGLMRAEKLLRTLKNFPLEPPATSGHYGNAWQLAFAYDFLRLYPGLSAADRVLLEDKIERALSDLLALLDSASPSLWHGCSTLAAMAWLCAVVLNPTEEERDQSVTRAQSHFLEVMNRLCPGLY